MPIVGMYYEPHGPGTTVVGSGPCSMDLVKTQRVMLVSGAFLEVEAKRRESEKGNYMLAVAIELQPLQRARFENATIIFSDIESGQTKSVLIDELHRVSRYDASDRNSTQNSTEFMDGGPEREGQGLKGIDYYFHIQLPFERPQSFTLVLPPLSIDNQRIVIAPIQFTYRKGGSIFGVLCAV